MGLGRSDTSAPGVLGGTSGGYLVPRWWEGTRGKCSKKKSAGKKATGPPGGVAPQAELDAVLSRKHGTAYNPQRMTGTSSPAPARANYGCLSVCQFTKRKAFRQPRGRVRPRNLEGLEPLPLAEPLPLTEPLPFTGECCELCDDSEHGLIPLLWSCLCVPSALKVTQVHCAGAVPYAMRMGEMPIIIGGANS